MKTLNESLLTAWIILANGKPIENDHSTYTLYKNTKLAEQAVRILVMQLKFERDELEIIQVAVGI